MRVLIGMQCVSYPEVVNLDAMGTCIVNREVREPVHSEAKQSEDRQADHNTRQQQKVKHLRIHICAFPSAFPECAGPVVTIPASCRSAGLSVSQSCSFWQT